MTVRELMRVLIEMSPDDEIEFQPVIRPVGNEVRYYQTAPVVAKQEGVRPNVPPPIPDPVEDTDEFNDIFNPLG